MKTNNVFLQQLFWAINLERVTVPSQSLDIDTIRTENSFDTITNNISFDKVFKSNSFDTVSNTNSFINTKVLNID